VTRYTPPAVALFNLIPTDIGRPLSHLTNQLDYPQLQADAHRVLKELAPVEREVSDARKRWYLARMLPYRTSEDRIAGVVLTLVDITERKSTQNALRMSEEHLRLIIDNATEYAIFSTDLARRVTSWSSGAERLLGWSESEMLGRPCDVIFIDEERAQGVPEQEAAQALAKGRAMDERQHQRKDGTRFWATGALMPMRGDDGQTIGFVKILRDQTDVRRSRDEVAANRGDR
jgi:two-component system, chemotaxis family, CheB/CheR fusion protein